MILQPIVENAILHGLDGVKDGLIRVTALGTRGGMLRITVEDNGHGLPAGLEGPYDPGRETGRKNHLGLYNVHTILLKYYGGGSGLYLGSGPEGRGAAVTATLPMRTGEEAPC